MRKSIISLLGKILTVITLYFLIESVIKLKIPFGQFFYDTKFIAIFSILVVIMTSIVCLNANIYIKILLHISRRQINKLELSNIYITSNIAKYLPGNVMHFVGRNLIGAKYGIEHKTIAIATGLEIFLTLVSCAILALLTGYRYLINSIEWYMRNNRNYMIFVYILFIIISIAIVMLIIKKRRTENLRSIFKKDNVQLIIRTLMLDILVFTITSFTYVALTLSIIRRILTIENLFIIFSVYLISWLFGYLTPGAPGGIGIREMILIMLLDGILPKDVIVVSTVFHRFVTIMADILAFLLLKAYIKFFNINFNGVPQ